MSVLSAVAMLKVVIYRQEETRPSRPSTITIPPMPSRRHRRRAARSAGPRGTQGDAGLEEGGGGLQAKNKGWNGGPICGKHPCRLQIRRNQTGNLLI